MPNSQRIIIDPVSHPVDFVVDAEFDRFDITHDLEHSLREVEKANFYHDALDVEE